MLAAWEKNPADGKKHFVKSVALNCGYIWVVLPWVMGRLCYSLYSWKVFEIKSLLKNQKKKKKAGRKKKEIMHS